ncbi:MAG: hypothetical protein ACRDLL_09245 [Solirubrobacterales bacterium]
MGDRETVDDLTYMGALAALVGMVGRHVNVHVSDAGDGDEFNHLATFGGILREGITATGEEPGDTEAIHLRFEAGEENAAINLERELFVRACIGHDSLTVQLGGVEFVIVARSG